MRKVLQEILEKNPRFHHLAPLKTKHIAHWCRCHGYTPPDPESLRSDGDSIEDVLTQIDSEPGKPSVDLRASPATRGGLHGTQSPLFSLSGSRPFCPSSFPRAGLFLWSTGRSLCSPLTTCPFPCLPLTETLQNCLCPRVPSAVPQPGMCWPRSHSRHAPFGQETPPQHHFFLAGFANPPPALQAVATSPSLRPYRPSQACLSSLTESEDTARSVTGSPNLARRCTARCWRHRREQLTVLQIK